MASPTAPQLNNGVTLATAFRALSNPIRRRTLEAIRLTADPDDVVRTDPLIEDEADRATRIQLHHTHLPLLSDAGLIEWNRAQKTLARGPRFDEIEPLLELLATHQDRLPAGWP